MAWGWKNVVGLIAVAFCVWLISYVVEWNFRTVGQVHMGDAFVRWWGNVVMLHWVERYQTLLAGILAVAAGSFVLLSTLIQRRDLHDSTRQQQYLALISDVAAIKRMCVIAQYRLNVDAPIAITRAIIEDIETRAYSLPAPAYDLATRVSACCSLALTSLEELDEKLGDGHDDERLDDAKRGIFLIVSYLQHHEELFQNGVFEHRLRVLDKEDAEEAKELGIDTHLKDLAASMVRFPCD